MGPIFNHSYSAVGRVALAAGTLNGLEVLTGKKQLSLLTLSLNYLVLHQFFKPLALVETQGLFSASVIIIGGISTLVETLLLFPVDKTNKNEESSVVKAYHSMNEMVVLAAGVVVVVSAILTTDSNIRILCVSATTLYVMRFARKFYKETTFINEMSQREESSSVVPEFLVDETTRLQGKEVHYLVGRNEFEKLRTFLTLDIPLNNPLLLGEPGSGKTELIKFLAAEINHGRVEGCDGWRVFSTTCTAIIEGTKFIGTMQEKIGRMFRFFEALIKDGEKVVVFIDEIHQAVSTGKSTSSDATSIAEALLTYMTNPRIRVIAATTHDNAMKLDQNPPFRERFEKVIMPRMTATRKQKILEVHLREIQRQFPTLTLPENLFERVQLANTLKGEKSLRRDIGLLYVTAANMDKTKRSVDTVLQEDLLEHIEGYLAILDSQGMVISEEFEEKLSQAKEQLGLGFGGENQIFARVVSTTRQLTSRGVINLDAVLEQVVKRWSA